jgi:hypothetical protein
MIYQLPDGKCWQRTWPFLLESKYFKGPGIYINKTSLIREVLTIDKDGYLKYLISIQGSAKKRLLKRKFYLTYKENPHLCEDEIDYQSLTEYYYKRDYKRLILGLDK